MKILNGTFLKVIAMITMVIDHLGIRYFTQSRLCRFFGRISFPLYAWFIAESVYYTEQKHKEVPHALRLFILALISEVPYDLYFRHMIYHPEAANVIFTLLTGYIVCVLMHKTGNILLKLFIIFTGCFIATYFHFSYRYIGVLMIVLLNMMQDWSRRTGKSCAAPLFLVLTVYVAYYVIHNVSVHTPEGILNGFRWGNWSQLGTYLAFPLIMLYSGKPGCRNRVFLWIYRLFYPLHLSLILLIEHFFFS